MDLENCPFCGNDAIYEDNLLWSNKDVVRCGCSTMVCRGYIKDSPYYQSFSYMAEKWNTRPESDKRRVLKTKEANVLKSIKHKWRR